MLHPGANDSHLINATQLHVKQEILQVQAPWASRHLKGTHVYCLAGIKFVYVQRCNKTNYVTVFN